MEHPPPAASRGGPMIDEYRAQFWAAMEASMREQETQGRVRSEREEIDGLMEERVVKLEEDSKVLTYEVTRRLSRSSESYLHPVQLGFDYSHRVSFELMKGYTKKIFPKGEWDNVDPIKAKGALD
ncbi:hypothetical protein LWI28_009573 [Acer negundo]|uniref:Uncharacterized protein n=1 Tax=Acer negundo TaxID=4023 RepID=A0AAD5IQN2_ACENE|nr:hypothetical protein LWI28_009573 [Acer negundo]